MKRYWVYFKYVFWHKYYVMLECFKVGLYWRGIVHDMSKLHPKEFFPYARSFYNADGSKRDKRDKSGYYDPLAQEDEFVNAWIHHAHHNDHHWQYWCMARDVFMAEDGEYQPEDIVNIAPMPKDAILEMICDWKGAAKAQENNNPEAYVDWWKKNKDKLRLHPTIRAWIEVSMPPILD